ncbi:MAG TPA: CoA transferase [Burkholderiales bacterium]|nr:CoA transferase [Burkholderiales bacterium]
MDLEQAFSGIKVLAVARIVAAPFAAYQLAMHGADVIHVEHPEGGDSSRTSGNLVTPFHAAQLAHNFLAYNANKRSMTLAISTPEGQEVFRRLAKSADVVIENLKGGTMARYGLGYEDLKKINPGIIFCSVTGYGQTGPKKSDPAIDGVIQAVSGMMSITGTPETGPLKSGSTIVDYTTGYAAALGIAIALFQRTRTGKGQAIDVAMLETAVTMMGGEVLRAITANETPPLVGNASGKGVYVSNTYRCKEGHLSIAAGGPSRREKLWKAIDGADVPQDPRFATDATVAKNMKALDEAVERKLSTKSAAEWEIILNKAGVPAMEVIPLARAVHHPQLEHRKFFHAFDDTEATGLPPFAVPTAPYRLSASPATIHSMPPRLGQHTDQVLAENGFSKEEIAQLRESKIV